ncbi:MAG: ABC transporter ATP-binding protein [Spirochaetia bacterium]
MLLNVKEVEKVYPLGKTRVHALKGISFSLDRGEFLSIQGPSGCGKTTLLNIVGCIDHPTKGTVEIDGIDVSSYSDSKSADIRLKRIGFIFQTFNLIPVLNIRENVEFPMILEKSSKKKRRRTAENLIAAVGLSDFIDHKPDELSGGQRQRVAIARALVNSPELVIADEPTANLDSETGSMIVNLMQKLNRDQGVSFIFSTHNPEVVQYADRKIKLRDGLIEDVEDKR